MAKISQSSAGQIARQISQKIQDEAQEVEKQIQNHVIPLYEATIPDEVKKLYEKHNQWMKGSNNVYIQGPGIEGNQSVYLRKDYPKTVSYTPHLTLSKKDAAIVEKLNQKKEKLNDKYDKTKREIEQTLLSLGTYKRALEAIPEILPYIPAQGGKNQGLMLVPSAVRETIQCLVSTDSKCIEAIK